jgi:hypothetical protein
VGGKASEEVGAEDGKDKFLLRSEKIAQELEGKLKINNIEVIGIFPNDPLVFEACLEGRTLLGEGAAFHAAGKVLDALL